MTKAQKKQIQKMLKEIKTTLTMLQTKKRVFKKIKRKVRFTKSKVQKAGHTSKEHSKSCNDPNCSVDFGGNYTHEPLPR